MGQNVVYQPGSNTDNTASRAVHFLRSTYDKNNDNKVITRTLALTLTLTLLLIPYPQPQPR